MLYLFLRNNRRSKVYTVFFWPPSLMFTQNKFTRCPANAEHPAQPIFYTNAPANQTTHRFQYSSQQTKQTISHPSNIELHYITQHLPFTYKAIKLSQNMDTLVNNSVLSWILIFFHRIKYAIIFDLRLLKLVLDIGLD